MVNIGKILVVFYVSIYQNAPMFQWTGQRNDFSRIVLLPLTKSKTISDFGVSILILDFY
jgi:hypothetical protein